VAETYKVTVAALATANELQSPYTIFIGQVLCIPGTTSTTTTSTSTTTSSKDSKDPVLDLYVVGNKLVIETTNFPKQSTYYVKAGEKNAKGAKWIKLGRLRVRKDGSGDGIYLMPKALRNSRVVEVCIKNNVNDDVACGRIKQGK
jgi:LysM repeat protein